MDQTVVIRPDGGLAKAVKATGLVLGGTFVAALTIGWVAFLLWLIAEGVITVVHWL